MRRLAASQRASISRVESFAEAHAETLNALAPESVDMIDFNSLREMDLDHPLHEAMMTTLSLAVRSCDPNTADDDLDTALDVAGSIWRDHGKDLCSTSLGFDMERILGLKKGLD